MVPLSAVSATEHSSDDPRIGLVLLDRYRIVKKLGAGGMGDVYEGVHELIGKKLAIKCLHADFAAHPEAVARFQRESRAATAVGNEHIVDVSDVGELPDGSPFMVMEYLQGQELAGLIDSNASIAVPRVIKIALEILEALHAAHKSGVVHRDMKPENVFLIQRGDNADFVKVLDFGISMITENSDAALGRMTQTGVAMGTPNYMSPEQAKGERSLDHRTDLYSLGVILYEILTGQVPFQAGTLAVLMTKILTEVPKPISEIRPDVPVALDRIILRAMAKEPAVRYEDAEEFADALRPFLDPDYVPNETGLSGNSFGPTVALAVPQNKGLGATRVLGAASKSSEETPSKESTAELPTKREGERQAEQTENVRELARLESEDGAPIPAFSQATLHDAGIMSRSPKRGLLIVAGLAALAAGVFVVSRSSGSGTTESGEPKNSIVTSTGSDAMPRQEHDARQTAATTVLPPVTEVLVKITASPSGAKVFVNGAPFPNGEEVNQLRATQPVQVMVSLDGYKLHNAVTVFDRDRSLHYELEKLNTNAGGKTIRNKGGKGSGKRNQSGENSAAKGDPVAEKDSNENKDKGGKGGESTESNSKFRETFE